ncbi:MAG TPA: hypothetical protein VOA87_04895 [Thermoanaerobaculia bacterium]|nr:hypothetical protein [Thermoanaerobaculia bacterium]
MTMTRSGGSAPARRLLPIAIAMAVLSTGSAAFAVTGNDAAYVSQVVPFGTIPLCQDTVVSVTMKNTGTTTWTSANGYKLGSAWTRDNTHWGTNRVALPNNVNPGDSVTFTFTVHPTTNGTFNFGWQMVQDPIEWFGHTSQIVAEYSPPSIATLTLNPTTIHSGQTSTGTVTLDGPAPASCGVVVLLSSSNTSVATVPPSITIPPLGTVGTFLVTAHSSGGASISAQSSVIKMATLIVN